MTGPPHLSHEYAEMWTYCEGLGEYGNSHILTVCVPYIWSELLSRLPRTQGMISAATMVNN